MRRLNIEKNIPNAIFGMVLCLLMGTVFLVGMSYFNAAIEPEEAICVEACYASYEESVGRNSRGLLVCCSDYKILDIDGACDSPALREKLDELAPGASVSLMIHPNASTILDMRYMDTVYLEFDNTVEQLTNERYGFLALGVLCYIGAAYFLFWMIRHQIVLKTYNEQKLKKKKK